MKKHFILLLLFAFGICYTVNAQGFKAKQRSQERIIKINYKKGKITEREYYKLMKEQDEIKYAIEKYEADDIWTPHEKNVVHEKLVRAEKRLRRYKTNSEIY